MAIERFSSRREALGPVLSTRLKGASRYLRIAGYFRSSLLEVVGESLETVDEIKVVCNGDLDPFDVKVAKAARDGQEALARTLVSSWQSTEDGVDLLLARERYRRLHDLLASGRMKVRVVPRDDQERLRPRQGRRHRARRRAGLFLRRQRQRLGQRASGTPTKSSGATRTPHAAEWVREEFEHFWRQGVDLPDAVVKHVAAMANRIEYRSIEEARGADGERAGGRRARRAADLQGRANPAVVAEAVRPDLRRRLAAARQGALPARRRRRARQDPVDGGGGVGALAARRQAGADPRAGDLDLAVAGRA